MLDLGDVVLAPGFVNAHAHLDLCALAGAVRPGGSFTGWIRALLVQRSALGRAVMARAARAGADRLLATGTTTVGDIEASGVASRALARHALRRRAYREVLDAGDPARTRAALARAVADDESRRATLSAAEDRERTDAASERMMESLRALGYVQ